MQYDRDITKIQMSYAWKPRTTTDMPAAFGRGSTTAMPTGFSRGTTEMPAAFSSGNRDTKRAEFAERAAHEAATARIKRIDAEQEAKRVADMTNFASETSYPSLGGSSVPKKPVTLNFKKTVQDMAARTEKEEAMTAARNAAMRPQTKYREMEYQQMTYAGDEEDGEEEEEEESDGEFNADLGSTRRRGDKGIW